MRGYSAPANLASEREDIAVAAVHTWVACLMDCTFNALPQMELCSMLVVLTC
jgi:hypothetical protein